MKNCEKCGNSYAQGVVCPYCGEVDERFGGGDAIRTLDIKEGFPNPRTTRDALLQAITAARQDGIKGLKVDHGYAASRAGSHLRTAVRNHLTLMVQEGDIAAFVGGEEFSTRHQEARSLITRHPWLQADRDLNRYNASIAMVVL